MRKSVILGMMLVTLPLTLGLTGCPPKPTNDTPSSSEVVPMARTFTGNKLNCELKNGPTGCVDEAELVAKAKAEREAQARVKDPNASEVDVSKPAAKVEFNPGMCKAIADGGTGFFAFYGTLLTGRLSELNKYCTELAADLNSPSDFPNTTQAGGFAGCVWKGRAYTPGESIFYSEGRILSKDLSINGQSFEALSGKSGPWQQCECSTSSKHWGCV